MAHKFVITDDDTEADACPCPLLPPTTRRVGMDPPTNSPTTATTSTPASATRRSVTANNPSARFAANASTSKSANIVIASANNMDEQTAARLYERSMQGNGPYDAISVNSEENIFEDMSYAEDDTFPEVYAPPTSYERVTSDYASTDYPPSEYASSTVQAGNLSPAIASPSNEMMGMPMQRDRTYTDESAASASSSGSVSKKTLVKLMREQVDLVRRLTNAQMSQKQELERVKEEKRVLEEQQQQQMLMQQQEQQQEQMKQQQQQQHQQHQQTRQQRREQEQMQQQARAQPYAMPHLFPATRPPRNRADTGDSESDSRSVSSRSFFKRSPMQHPRRHPDSKYFKNNNGYDENTIGNGSASMASTIMPRSIVVNKNDAQNTKTGPSGPSHPAYTGPGACVGFSKDRIEITHIPDRNVVREEEGNCTSSMWWGFSRLCTILIPDFCLFWIGSGVKITNKMSREAKEEALTLRREARQAWREKVAIFIIMMSFCAAFIGVSGVIPMFLCRETTVFTLDEIQARDKTEDWTVIFGTIYDVENYASVHPGGPSTIRDYVGKDASKMFPRRPPAEIPQRCLNLDKEVKSGLECESFDEVDQLVNLQCHTNVVGFSGVEKYMGGYERGVLAHRRSSLKNDINTQWIQLYDRIYNVTNYVNAFTDSETGEIDEDSEYAFLHDDLNKMIVNTLGEDATSVYEALYDDDVALSCLDDLFYMGILDESPNMYCQILSYVMYAIMIMIAAVLAIQCLCSLIYLVRWKRTIKRDDTRSKMIIMVPCYNEGDKELRKTIDSVMDTSYPDDNKVLLVIADGNITGKGERCSTPETLAKILGYKMNPNDRVYNCKSIGELTENRAKVQYGIYKDAGKELKYMVIVKCGVPSEKGSPRAGNRGKRDSQLLFSGLLNRFHHGRELNELDKAIKNALDHLQLPLDEVRFLMAIDADTRIDRESLSHMTYSMNKNDQILALCGETKVDNKSQSWVTMIQVFEYYTNHHMKKAFESAFGCVTCLPGCFTMYRLFSDDGRPLLSCDDVYQRYATNNVKTLHEKNLYHLGEDRMLTTLLLRYFPDMRLSFVPEAYCYTIVPHTFSVLLSQRRRWINSTFHNMLELIRVNTMCGVCCLSMKSIVILDMVATLILPASLIYVGYIVYITVWMGEPLSLLIIVMWGIVIGVQVVVFLLRSRWDYWWWFLVFVFAGVPVFYFVLPLYSFWHMDDFSWGTTRQVSAPPASAAKPGASGDTLPERDSPEQAANRKTALTNPPKPSVQNRRHENSAPVDVDDVGKLNLKPKLHAPTTTNVDRFSGDELTIEGQTVYRADKYRDAEEAKRIRRLRRAEC